MPCYRPLKGYRSAERNPSGKRSIVFSARVGLVEMPVDLPCGQCIGCRLERSRQWAIRCFHEASLHEDNCFLTLTYDDEHLPSDGSLDVKHFQDFMKRFRFRFSDTRIRFFHCGEYGETFKRPHYHAIIFGFDFPDKKLWREVRGNRLYTSEILSELWPSGFHTIGDVTFESAAYVARYITKKITGDDAAAHYGGRKPEYTTMSRRPGIAGDWFKKFKSDVFPSDQVVITGRHVRISKPPKYYSRMLELSHPDEAAELKSRRRAERLAAEARNPDPRLAVREKCQELKHKLLKRGYENGEE